MLLHLLRYGREGRLEGDFRFREVTKIFKELRWKIVNLNSMNFLLIEGFACMWFRIGLETLCLLQSLFRRWKRCSLIIIHVWWEMLILVLQFKRIISDVCMLLKKIFLLGAWHKRLALLGLWCQRQTTVVSGGISYLVKSSTSSSQAILFSRVTNILIKYIFTLKSKPLISGILLLAPG